jgi:oxygen-independent coproporphyrinogen-3 oxidase
VALYECAVDRLGAAGIPQYEISNFARPGAESVHNLKYWRMEPYAGFGADAHSFDGAVRRQNPESPEEYVAGAPAVETPSAPDERFLTGLRLREGMRLTAGEWERYSATIRRFTGLGLLETDGTTLRLTRRGILLSNEVFQDFIP